MYVYTYIYTVQSSKPLHLLKFDRVHYKVTVFLVNTNADYFRALKTLQLNLFFFKYG